MPLSQDPPAIRLDDIARVLGGRIVGAADTIVSGVSSLEDAGPGDLAYVSNERFLAVARASRAVAFVVERPLRDLPAPQIVVENPGHAFATAVRYFFVPRWKPRGIAERVTRGSDVSIGPDASIWPFVTLGDRVSIGSRVTLFPGVFIGDDSVVGDDTVLYPNVTVREGSLIGSRVIVHSGTVIGSDGFGYIQHQGRHHKVPQIGAVTLEDDVELGANVTVDRATFGRTVIKRGTKVDNLVQIAHNVTVGEDSILVAQVGIAGSTTLHDHVIVGGQVGISDHLTIGEQVRIAARSGVIRDVAPRQTISGAPAMPHEEFLKAQAVFPLLPQLRRQVRDLQQRIERLESAARGPRGKKRTKKKKR